MVWYDFAFSPITWVILGLIAMFAYGIIKSSPLKKVPVFNNKSQLLMVCVVCFLLTSGILGSLGLGNIISGDKSSSPITISQLQTTTAYQVTGAATAQADSSSDTTKQSDFYLNETQLAGNAHINLGVMKVTRAGSLDASSCEVSVLKPERYSISDTTYHIVDESASTGTMFAYISTGSTSAAATSADPKETNQLSFAEGVSTGFVGLNITLDETGFDPLNLYDTKTIPVDICGYNYNFIVHKADA
jgi:hypothetical protein